MSNSYNKVSYEATNILYYLQQSSTGALPFYYKPGSYAQEALHQLERRNLVERLTKTHAYQITPLGIYVYGLINEKTKEVLNDTN